MALRSMGRPIGSSNGSADESANERPWAMDSERIVSPSHRSGSESGFATSIRSNGSNMIRPAEFLIYQRESDFFVGQKTDVGKWNGPLHNERLQRTVTNSMQRVRRSPRYGSVTQGGHMRHLLVVSALVS